MDILRRHYDVVASVGTAGVFLITGAPWPFWAVWGVVVTYQAQHIVRRRPTNA